MKMMLPPKEDGLMKRILPLLIEAGNNGPWVLQRWEWRTGVAVTTYSV